MAVEGSDLGPFYSQLKTIKDYHRRQPAGTLASDSIEIGTILENGMTSTKLSSVFTGEERNGRFLDLYMIYDEAINIISNNSNSFDYLKYLKVFDNPIEYVPEGKRSTLAYSNYLDNLLNYLKDFVEKTRPIAEITKINLKEIEIRHQDEELKLLNNLSTTGSLFCAPCDKLFTNSSVFEAHFKGKKHLKSVETFSEEGKGKEKKDQSGALEKLIEKGRLELKKKHSIEIKEAFVTFYGEILKEVKDSTRGNVERKQALTSEERIEAENDSEEEEEEGNGEGVESTDMDNNSSDSGKIYNPLKLPLDWDGKPIPFWLWKLHGLGVPFECEICGNYVYMGRRAFDQHFYEWRHNHGMKCLGVPNTSHFFQITKIGEVKRLWEKMRVTAKSEALRSDWMEECEDSSGNVYDKRTFEYLKRQGLI